MLLRFNASTTVLPLVVSPASISMVFPAGEEMSIESPLIGPTSSIRIVSSPPDAGGGCVLHHGKTYFHAASPAATATAKRTAIAQPQPLVARRTLTPSHSFIVEKARAVLTAGHRLDSARAARPESQNNLPGHMRRRLPSPSPLPK